MQSSRTFPTCFAEQGAVSPGRAGRPRSTVTGTLIANVTGFSDAKKIEIFLSAL